MSNRIFCDMCDSSYIELSKLEGNEFYVCTMCRDNIHKDNLLLNEDDKDRREFIDDRYVERNVLDCGNI